MEANSTPLDTVETSMATFLQIIGALALLVLLALAVGFVWLRYKLRHFSRSLGGLTEAFESRISLTPDSRPLSTDVETRVQTLEDAGFTRVGTYRIDELNGLRVVGLVDEAQSRLAAVYEGKDHATWADIFIRYESAGSLTVSNASTVAALDRRPGHKKIIDPSLDEAQLLTRASEELSPGPLKPVSATDFVAAFEGAYAEEMEWRLKRGGATLEETARIAESMDGTFTEAEIAEAQEALRAQASGAMTEVCRQSFAASMDGAAWERLRDRVTIVHENMTPTEVWSAMEEYLSSLEEDVLSDDDYDTLTERVEALLESERPALSLADAINTLAPEPARLRIADTMSEPVAAVVYLAP